MRRKFFLLLAAIALLNAPPLRADLQESDTELIAHLLTTDPVLSRLTGECRGSRIERGSTDGLARFTLTASCPAPPPEDDCPNYRVTARGTVDTASQATIRDLRFELVCTDDPGTVGRIGDSFSGPFDVVTALTLIYGRAPWNAASTTPFSSSEDGRDFVEPRFDQAFVEEGVEKHVVIATLTPRPRSQYDCHACSPMLGGAVFRRDGERWRIESIGREIEHGHAWFDSTHGRLGLVRIGPERYGLLHRNDDVSGGFESRKASLIFGIDGELGVRFSYRMPESGDTAGPGACPVPEIDLDVAIASENPPGDAGFFDVIVDAAWNEARCRMVEVDGGPGVAATGESCRRRIRYRFETDQYRPISTEFDECTPIPERAVSLRG